MKHQYIFKYLESSRMSDHTILKERLPADDVHDIALQVREQMKQQQRMDREKQKRERDEERLNIAKNIHHNIKTNIIPELAHRGKMKVKVYLVRRPKAHCPGHPCDAYIDMVLWGCGDYDYKTLKLLRKLFNKDGFGFTWDYARKYVYNSYEEDDYVITISWKKTSCVIM